MNRGHAQVTGQVGLGPVPAVDIGQGHLVHEPGRVLFFGGQGFGHDRVSGDKADGRQAAADAGVGHGMGPGRRDEPGRQLKRSAHGQAVGAHGPVDAVDFDDRPQADQVAGGMVQAAEGVDDLLVFHGLGFKRQGDRLVGKGKSVQGYVEQVNGVGFGDKPDLVDQSVRQLRVLAGHGRNRKLQSGRKDI